jgi:hypothetical protein
MKIRPTGPSELPPEPEEIKDSGKPEFAVENQDVDGSEVAERARENRGVSSEVLSELGKAKDKGDLGNKFVDLALGDLSDSLPGGDLDQIRSLLKEQVQADPFIQDKLDRVFSLLGKSR